MDELRPFLYPLGWVATLFFGARFALQWFQSELSGESYAGKSFWYLSLTGNCLLAIHCFLQVQYPICCVQVINGWIAWRNLQLLEKKPPLTGSLQKWAICLGFFSLVTLLFFVQGLFSSHHHSAWLRVPQAPWQQGETSLGWGWHLFGIFGYVLFSLRFWVQWWRAEKEVKSRLSLDFWWLSLVGALLSCLYFWKMGDTVNLIGPLVGLPAYIRNIQLLKKRVYS